MTMTCTCANGKTYHLWFVFSKRTTFKFQKAIAFNPFQSHRCRTILITFRFYVWIVKNMNFGWFRDTCLNVGVKNNYGNVSIHGSDKKEIGKIFNVCQNECESMLTLFVPYNGFGILSLQKPATCMCAIHTGMFALRHTTPKLILTRVWLSENILLHVRAFPCWGIHNFSMHLCFKPPIEADTVWTCSVKIVSCHHFWSEIFVQPYSHIYSHVAM